MHRPHFKCNLKLILPSYLAYWLKFTFLAGHLGEIAKEPIKKRGSFPPSRKNTINRILPHFCSHFLFFPYPLHSSGFFSAMWKYDVCAYFVHKLWPRMQSFIVNFVSLFEGNLFLYAVELLWLCRIGWVFPLEQFFFCWPVSKSKFIEDAKNWRIIEVFSWTFIARLLEFNYRVDQCFFVWIAIQMESYLGNPQQNENSLLNDDTPILALNLWPFQYLNDFWMSSVLEPKYCLNFGWFLFIEKKASWFFVKCCGTTYIVENFSMTSTKQKVWFSCLFELFSHKSLQKG